jgi:hypothetical protein
MEDPIHRLPATATHVPRFLPRGGWTLFLRIEFSITLYEQYRALFGTDPDFIEADRIRDDSGCVLRYERTFMRPLLPGNAAG